MSFDNQHLLNWCQSCTKNYSEINITNFTTSWTNGLAFNALIHSYKPDLFDFNELLNQDSNKRFENVFKIVKEDFGINTNLTLSDLQSKQLDNNKIILFLSLLYKYFYQDNSENEFKKFTNTNLCDKDLIIKNYQDNVEDVLTWILGAEEQLSAEDNVGEKCLDSIQQLFQNLDRFTTESRDKQQKIKDILNEGQILIKSKICDDNERKEIKLQRDLLNQRWNDLKNKINDKQEELHNTLMALQKKHLNEFSIWLKNAEHEIANFEEFGSDLETIQRQYEQHMKFNNEVQKHEDTVKILSNMLIIIDECENPNFSSENLSDDLVDELEALAEKWENVCNIVMEREKSLELIIKVWQTLEEQENNFNNWVFKIVKRLQEIEEAANQTDINFLNNLFKRLDKMEKDVNVQLSYYSKIFKQGQTLLNKIDKNSKPAIYIKQKMDSLSDQWDSIMNRMNKISCLIRETFDMHNKNSQNTKRIDSTLKNYLTNENNIKTKKIEDLEENKDENSLKNINLKLNEWRASFDLFCEWLNKCESLFGLDAKNENEASFWDQLDVKEQQVFFEETIVEVENNTQIYKTLINQGKEFIDKLNTINENTKEIENDVILVIDRWNSLNEGLKKKHHKVISYTNLLKLHTESTAIIRVLELNIKKLESEKVLIKKLNLKQNYVELNKMYEQYKLRINSIFSQEKHVESIKSKLTEIFFSFPDLKKEQMYADLEYFFDYWHETNEKINMLEKEVENIYTENKIVKKKEEQLSEVQPKLVKVINVLENWLNKAHKTCILAPIYLYLNPDEYNSQIQQFENLKSDIKVEKPNLDYINETIESIVKSNFESTWIPSLKSKIRDFNLKWNKTIEILNKKIQDLQKLQELLPKIDVQINNFYIWLEEVQSFLKESNNFTDNITLQEQIKEYDDLIKDIDGEVFKSVESVKVYYKNILEIIDNKELSESILSLHEIDKNFHDNENHEILKNKVQEMIKNCNLIREETVSKRDLLYESLNKCIKINEKMDNFNNELDKIKCSKIILKSIDQLDKNLFDLENTKEKLIKNLKSCVKMKNNLLHLTENGKFESNAYLEKFISKITNLETKCNEAVNEISKRYSSKDEIKIKYDEFKKFLQSNQEWLEKLEKIISRSIKNMVDAEEISDYLDNLENHLRTKPEKDLFEIELKKKAEELMEYCFDVSDEIDRFEQFQYVVNAESAVRQKQLEQMLSEAELIEDDILKIKNSLDFIDCLFHKIENENEDFYNDENEIKFKDIVKKLKNISTILSSLSNHVNKYITDQRYKASSRLENQIEFLQLKYNQLDKKFNEIKNILDYKYSSNSLLVDSQKIYYKMIYSEENKLNQDYNINKNLNCSSSILSSETSKLEDKKNDKEKSYLKVKSHSDLNLSNVTNDKFFNQYNSTLFKNDVYNNQELINNEISQVIEINFNNNEYLIEQKNLFEQSVDFPWERAMTSNHVPYFINHELQQTFWNHPNIMILMDDLTELNEIYYAAYRTSIKLRTVQQTLCLSSIHITNICKIFDTFDFLNDNLVSIPEMISCLKRIYEDISNKVMPITNYGLMIDMTLNWILNLYDLERTGYIKMLAFKICLACMSKASIEEKYKVLYQLIADSKGLADKYRVSLLLKYLLEIPKLLGDIAAFGGSNYEPSIRSCFEESHNNKELNVKTFLIWLKKEPQSLVWLPLLHRLIIAECSQHPVRCSICKTQPIQGFRYKCLKCFNCDICQTCFLLRRPLNGHKNTHPIKEYCCATNTKKEVSDFGKIFRNKFKSSRKSFKKHFKDSYLPVDSILNDLDNYEKINQKDKSGVSLLQYSPLTNTQEEIHNEMEELAKQLAEVESSKIHEENFLSCERIMNNFTLNESNGFLDELISKNSDEHDLIMNYCNYLNSNKNNSNLNYKNNDQFHQNDHKNEQIKNSSFDQNDSNNFHFEKDEHDLIKDYCNSLNTKFNENNLNKIKNPNQVINSFHENRKKELFYLVKQLEKENHLLELVYQKLKKQKFTESKSSLNETISNNSSDFIHLNENLSQDEAIQEKNKLIKHNEKLEEKMEMLEKQNKTIQDQLYRMKMFF